MFLMRLTQFKRASFPANLFVSAKCTTALPVANLVTRDYLIQASLDPAVSKLDFLSYANVGEEIVRLDTIVVHRDGGRYALDIEETSPVRDLDEEGLVLVAYDLLGLDVLRPKAADVRAEPRLSNARTVWSHHGRIVGYDDREAICGVLEEQGALPMRKLEVAVQTSRPLAGSVYALACEGVLDLDVFGEPLSGRTVIRMGSKAPRNMPAPVNVTQLRLLVKGMA
jgi:hypothetical protein